MEDILKNMAGIEIEISVKNEEAKSIARSESFTSEGKTRNIRGRNLTKEELKTILNIVLKEEK